MADCSSWKASLAAAACLLILLVLAEFNNISHVDVKASSKAKPNEPKKVEQNVSSAVVQTIQTSALKEVISRDRPAYFEGKRLCSRSEIRNGNWITARAPRLLYTPTRRLKCKNDGLQGTWTRQWKPFSDDCELLDIFTDTALDDYCRLLHNRTVVFMGDSLMYEMFHSILHIFKLPSETVMNTFGVLTPFCNGTAHAVWGEFSLNLTALHEQGKNPDYILINWGAHYQEDDKFKVMMNGLFDKLRNYQRLSPTSRFFWKTTAPGHPHCWNLHSPINNATTMENMVQNLSLYDWSSVANTFNWWLFEAQNKLVLAWLKSSGLPFEVMDGYDMLLLRPDQHRGKIKRGRKVQIDCLHHCSPGPPDVFIRLLYHYLHMSPEQVMSSKIFDTDHNNTPRRQGESTTT